MRRKKRRREVDNNPTNSPGQSGKFFNGFLLGFIIGGVSVFLLGTKKGKKLLKAISEEGIDSISNILEEADKSVDLDEVIEEEEPSFTKATEGQREDIAPKKEFVIKEKSIEEKPKVRRFFRGISRHVN